MKTETYDLAQQLADWKPGQPDPRKVIVGKRAVWTSAWSGERMEGVIEGETRLSDGYPIVRFADGRWGRCDDRIELIVEA